MNERPFPTRLLKQPIAERLAYFKTKMVAHEHLLVVHKELLYHVRCPGNASLILVFGPTGVGKTTLRLRLEQELYDEAEYAPEYPPGNIPILSVEAIASDSGDFRWRDYYIRCLMALDEPLINAKVTYQVRGINRSENGDLVVARDVVNSDLRRVLEKALLHRRPQAVLVDEAQHFRKVASGHRLLDQMDTLKSLASLSQTVHVLFGTYDLLDLADLSAQLNRRSLMIHFKRYQAEAPGDLDAFRKLLRTFQRHLPLTEEPDLETHWEQFYEGSLGCAGILKDWLVLTLSAALEQSASTLTPKLWERYATPSRRLIEQLRDIRRGEARVLDQESDNRQLRALLELPAPPPLMPEMPRPKSRPVGHRLPGRDLIGASAHDPE